MRTLHISAKASLTLMAAAAVMSLALLTIVSKLSHRQSAMLEQQKLWAWNMGYEHHEQPPFQTFPVRPNTAETKSQVLDIRFSVYPALSYSLASQAKVQQLWGFNMGYEHHEQPPFQTFPVRQNTAETKSQAKVQQLWGFNLGYEHHEQKPISFGAVTPAAAKQMQLWGWNMGYEHHEQKPIPFGVKPNEAQKQQLWGFNMGYEHHEQKPIPFGVKNKQAAGLAAQKQQLWGFNMGYEHHEQPPLPFGVVARNGPAAAVATAAGRTTQLLKVDSYDSEAEENMDPTLGRGADLHVLTKSGLWTKPEFKNFDQDYDLHTLQGTAEA